MPDQLRTHEQWIFNEAPFGLFAAGVDRYPTEEPGSIVLRQGEYWGFEVDNQLDQAVNVSLIGGRLGSPRPSSMGNLGVTVAIAAGTREPVVTNLWLPNLSLFVTCPVGAAAGFLSAWGFVQVRQNVRA